MVSNRGNSAVVAQMPGKIDRRRWYRLRVQARGSRFKVFLDGKLLMSFYTDAYPRGCVGVVTNASARFRNLKVADPNGKVLLEGVRNVLPKTKPSSATPVTPNVLIASPKRTKAQAVLELGAHLQNAVRLDPGDAGARFALGGFHAQWGEWKEAAAAYDRGLELDPTSYERWREAAVVHRAADDVEGYRRTCRQLVRRFGDTDNPAVADRIVITCLLLPDALPAADFDLVQQLAERAVTGTEKHAFYRYFAKTKGLAEYRAGRHARAVKWLDRCPEADAGLQDALLLTYRAMARHGLGQTGEAVAALGRARALLATMPDPAAGRQPVTDWHGLMYGWLLYREAESLLKKK